MTSEWKDHVAYCALEIAAEKEGVPYGYDDLRDEHIMFVEERFPNYICCYFNGITKNLGDLSMPSLNQEIDADLKKYWHATQGDDDE